MNVFVANESHGATGKGRHIWQADRLVAGHFGFDDFEWIFWGLECVDCTVFMGNGDLVFKHTNDFAWMTAKKGEATDALAANDGLEEKCRSVFTDLRISPQRCFAVCRQVDIHWHSVALLGECFEYGSGRLDIHKKVRSLNIELLRSNKNSDEAVKVPRFRRL